MSLNFCAIVASFLAYGIFHLDGVAGKAGWRQVTRIPHEMSDFVDRVNS